MPHWSEFNNTPITGPTAMSNIFDKYVTCIAKKTNCWAVFFSSEKSNQPKNKKDLSHTYIQ